MDVSDPRGRPKKDPEDRRSVVDTVKVRPSKKEILEQEAERCGAGMSKILRKHAFERIEPQGRAIPTPGVLGWILSISGQLGKKAKTLDVEWLLADLRELESELQMKGVEVQRRRSRRETCRAKAAEEKRTAQVSVRFTPAELEWLEGRASERGVPMRTLLREAAFENIRDREQMQKIEERLKSWAEGVKKVRTEEETEGAAPQSENRVRAEMKGLARVISDFVKEETRWGTS